MTFNLDGSVSDIRVGIRMLTYTVFELIISRGSVTVHSRDATLVLGGRGYAVVLSSTYV
jgi:hypothetical protein